MECHNKNGVAGKKSIGDYSHPVDIYPRSIDSMGPKKNLVLPVYMLTPFGKHNRLGKRKEVIRILTNKLALLYNKNCKLTPYQRKTTNLETKLEI